MRLPRQHPVETHHSAKTNSLDDFTEWDKVEFQVDGEL
jgi:hypothetical protein